MLAKPLHVNRNELRDPKFKQWLSEERSKGVHYHFHAFSDGKMMICPPGTEVESDTGDHYEVQENGSVKKSHSTKRASRAKIKKVTAHYRKLGIKMEIQE
jgi:predicted deacetylase